MPAEVDSTEKLGPPLAPPSTKENSRTQILRALSFAQLRLPASTLEGSALTHGQAPHFSFPTSDQLTLHMPHSSEATQACLFSLCLSVSRRETEAPRGGVTCLGSEGRGWS